MPTTRARAIFWLSIVWLVLRIYPAFMGCAATGTEVRQGHKLIEYGFARLHGGAVAADAWTGIVAHPERHLYTHHPYPIVWFVAALLYLFGITGVAAAMFALKYAALVLCFLVLDRCFPRTTAFWAAFLYAVAPVSVVLDGNANAVVVASAFWPLAFALILFRFQPRDKATVSDLFLAGGTVFVAGQISWFALAMAPALAAVNSRVSSFRLDSLRKILVNPVSLAFLAGACLSAALFAAQVFYYEPNLVDLKNYVVMKAGVTTHTMPRSHLISLVPLRAITFTGITLILTSILGVFCLIKEPRFRQPPAFGLALYLLTFAGVAFLLPGFFHAENHIYTWLVFPGTFLAAVCFEKFGAAARNLILLSSALGIATALMYASVPVISPMSRFMGALFASHTRETDFIFTNLKPAWPPYKPSDVTGGDATAGSADRLIFYDVTAPAMLSVAPDLVNEATGFQYWRFRSLPVAPELEAQLTARGKLLQTLPVAFPDQRPTLAEKLRAFYWYKVMKKGKPVDAKGRMASDSIDVYEVRPESVRF